MGINGFPPPNPLSVFLVGFKVLREPGLMSLVFIVSAHLLAKKDGVLVIFHLPSPFPDPLSALLWIPDG